MANSVILGPNPFMQFTGIDGKWAAYGYVITKDWFTREDKVTYEDPDATTPLANPIPLDGLGRTVPVFWEQDSPYYLEVRANDDTLIWQSPEPYYPGDGGSTILDEALDSVNLFSNGQFYEYPTQSYSPVEHEIPGLAMLGWGWRQNGTNTSDTLEFIPFTLDDNSINPPAVNYLRYTSLLNGTGESVKQLYFSFPNVRVLANEQITISFEARSQIAGNFQLGVGVIQRFGTGGSPAVTTLFGSATLTTAFQQLSVTGNVPDLSGKTLGSTASALEIIINFPLNSAQRIDITNLYLKRGAAVNGYPYVDPYHDLAAIYGYNGQWSTGDRKESYKPEPDIGWILADDGSIGNTGSGATNLASPETYNLFKLFWDTTSDTDCPVRFLYSVGTASQSGDTVTGVGTTFTVQMEGGQIIWASGQTAIITDFVDATHLTVNTTATVPVGPYVIKYGDKGLTATADFLAGKVLQLPLTVNRPAVMASATHPVGSSYGSDLLAAANFPTGLQFNSTLLVLTGGPGGTLYETFVVGSGEQVFNDTVVSTGPVGAANTPFISARSAVNVFIKL